MKISPSDAEQWRDLRKLRIASIEESPESFELTVEQARDFSDGRWQTLAAGGDGLSFFIAYDNDKPIGMVGTVITHYCELIALWVRPDCRERSVASALIETVKSHAIKLEYTSVTLMVAKENVAACALYEKFGFSVTRQIAKNGKQLQEMRWSQN